MTQINKIQNNSAINYYSNNMALWMFLFIIYLYAITFVYNYDNDSFYSCKFGGATKLHIWASNCTIFRKVSLHSEAPSKKSNVKAYQFYFFERWYTVLLSLWKNFRGIDHTVFFNFSFNDLEGRLLI